ncbi:MAG: SRPBCC domain-containing protein [Bacteroidia bacterium]
MIASPIKLTASFAVPAAVVWDHLTCPEKISHWMGQELDIHLETDWTIGGRFVLRAFHIAQFENTGKVLDFDPKRRLQYTYKDSISRLPDVPSSYTTLTFQLKESGQETDLCLTIEGFPTETIFHHLNFYWRGAMVRLKDMAESSPVSA